MKAVLDQEMWPVRRLIHASDIGPADPIRRQYVNQSIRLSHVSARPSFSFHILIQTLKAVLCDSLHHCYIRLQVQKMWCPSCIFSNPSHNAEVGGRYQGITDKTAIPKLLTGRNKFFFFSIIWNQQSEYKAFYKLMGWLWVILVDVLARWGALLREDLILRITGQLATAVSVFVRRYPVEWGGVVGSSEFLVLCGAWYFWCGWLLARLEYLGLRGS